MFRLRMIPVMLLLGVLLAVAAACGGGSHEPLTEAQLTEALFTQADMPVGWKAEIPDDPVRSFCGVEFPATATAEVVIAFYEEDAPPYATVTQFVQAFPPGEAERAMADGLPRIQSCTGWSVGIALGEEITERVSPISFPTLGDDTLALRKYREGPIPVTVTVDVIYVRRGDLVTTIIYRPWFGNVSNIDQVEEFARRADEKLAALD